MNTAIYPVLENPIVDKYKENYPWHPSLVDPNAKDMIKCLSCNSGIVITRHIPFLDRESMTLGGPSQYHPQPMEYCKCRSLAVMVDHRGNVRVYTDESEGWAWVNSILKVEAKADIKVKIPKIVLDGPKPDRSVKPIVPSHRYRLYLTGVLDMRRTNAQIYMPMPLKASSKYVYYPFLRSYAMTYDIVVLTDLYTFLPDGSFLAPYPKSIKAEDAYTDLGITTKKYYGLVIDLLHILPHNPNLIVWKQQGTKIYVNSYTHELATKRKKLMAGYRALYNRDKNTAMRTYTHDMDEDVVIPSTTYLKQTIPFLMEDKYQTIWFSRLRTYGDAHEKKEYKTRYLNFQSPPYHPNLGLWKSFITDPSKLLSQQTLRIP